MYRTLTRVTTTRAGATPRVVRNRSPNSSPGFTTTGNSHAVRYGGSDTGNAVRAPTGSRKYRGRLPNTGTRAAGFSTRYSTRTTAIWSGYADGRAGTTTPPSTVGTSVMPSGGPTRGPGFRRQSRCDADSSTMV